MPPVRFQVPVPNVSNESHPSQNRQFWYNQSGVPKEINLKISCTGVHLQLHLLKLQRGRYLLPGRKWHMVPVEGHHMRAHLCCRLQMFHLQTQPVNSTQTCAITSCFACWFHTNIAITSCFICWFHTNMCYYKLFHITGCFCLTLIIFLGMPVMYFVPDLTAQPASIPHPQGHWNADNWSGASGFFAYFWLITSWCTSNWPNISSNRTALLHCCAECQKTLSSAKLHCLSRLMQNTISVSLCFEHKDPFFISFNVTKNQSNRPNDGEETEKDLNDVMALDAGRWLHFITFSCHHLCHQ